MQSTDGRGVIGNLTIGNGILLSLLNMSQWNGGSGKEVNILDNPADRILVFSRICSLE